MANFCFLVAFISDIILVSERNITWPTGTDLLLHVLSTPIVLYLLIILFELYQFKKLNLYTIIVGLFYLVR